MYTMTHNGRPLYDPTMPGITIESPLDMLEANKISTLTFTVYQDNPEFYSIIPRVSVIRAYRDGQIFSVFRPVRARRVFQGGVEYTCEEMTAILNDFLHRPAAFPVDPTKSSVRDFMELCISEFNVRNVVEKIRAPKSYAESLYPFTFLGTPESYSFSAGTLKGTPPPWIATGEIVQEYGLPPMIFVHEMANVLAVLGYFGNIYIPPNYDWPYVWTAMKQFADNHNIEFGHRKIYYNNGEYDYIDYIDWRSDDGWDERVVDEVTFIQTLDRVYYEHLQSMPSDGGDGEIEYQSFTFAVGDTPAALDKDTGEPILITLEANGYTGYWDYMQESIVDQLGGYIIPEWTEHSCTLHYKRDEDLPICDQTITFGENIIDLVVDTDSEKVYSIVIPLGKDGLTINVDDDEPDYITYSDAINLYGKKEITKEWKDIEDKYQLKYTASQWLFEHAIKLRDEFEITAIDLKYAGVNVGHLEFMHRVRVIVDKYGIDQYCTMTSAEIALDSPVNDRYQFNGERDSLVDKIKK